MATQGVKFISGPYEIREYDSAATGTYVAGDVVGLSSGACVIGADNLCMGVALEDALTSGKTKIIVIDTAQVWNVEYADTTSTAMQGEDYLMTFDTGSQCLSTTTTTPTMTVLKLDPRDGAKLYGRVHAKFNQAVCQASGLLVNA
jgi:hypothetical protein